MKSLHNFISYPVDYSGGFSLTCSESLDDSTRNANSTAKALNGPVTALDSMGTTDKIALQMCTISCTKDGYLTHVERVDDVLCSHMDRSKHGNENHHRSYDIIICITHWIGMGKKKGESANYTFTYIHLFFNKCGQFYFQCGYEEIANILISVLMEHIVLNFLHAVL